MDNPYKVLGLDKTATDEEIKAAYHNLVKKYHPDKYQDNPLADLAEEKLREINEAYDLLMNKNVTSAGYGSSSSYGGSSYGGGSGYGSSGYGNTSSYGSTGYGNSSAYGSAGYGYDHGQGGGYSAYASAQNSSHYAVREALDRNQFSRAEQLLYSSSNRDAEWHFLAGVLSYKKGYYDDALNKINYAMTMDPTNPEYRSIYQQIRGTGALYKTTSNGRGYSDSNLCTDLIACYCCTSLISPCW